jgi:hypothetical protein
MMCLKCNYGFNCNQCPNSYRQFHENATAADARVYFTYEDMKRGENQ